MLRAALQEFSERGYEQASTNRIVEEAGIGKGMLFYYFRSKKDLFRYLVDYAIGFVVHEYLNRLDEGETDIVERYRQAARVKMEAYAKNPDVFIFLGTLYLDGEAQLPEDLVARLGEVRRLSYSKRFGNVDTTLFRDDVSPEKVVKLIHWSLEGYESELIGRLKGEKLSSVNFDPYWEEFYGYLDVLRMVYYRPREGEE